MVFSYFFLKFAKFLTVEKLYNFVAYNLVLLLTFNAVFAET
jgi:hypothetical protein